MMKQSTKPILALSSLIVMCASIGCTTGKQDGWKFTQSLDPRRMIGIKKDEVAQPQIPTRLVSTWEDTVLNQVGKKSQRGFGGRVLFFNNESDDPIRVEGQLVVYAYDENGRPAHETHPTRRFVFPAEQFTRHESECKLGASYSVWLPWDELGGKQMNISLIARFEPKGGALVAGDQTRHLLPGTRQLADGETAPPVKQVSDIQLTEYTQKSQVALPKSAKVRTKPISISLSQDSWQQRLANAKEELAQKSKDLPLVQ